MRRTRRSAWAGVGVAAVLALSACTGSGTGPGLLQGTGQQVRGSQDVNPQDPATLRDGGDLRIPIDVLPDNWNYNQVDGTNGEASEMEWAFIPRAFDDGPAGLPVLNTDYVTRAELTSSSPQTITYDIHPAATWTSGRPITWQDFAAQGRALDGSNPAYESSSSTGYDRIASITRGSSDKQVVVTFAAAFAEWPALFSPLYPMETNADPAIFNEGWLTSVLDSAGPFRVDVIDTTAQTVTMVRNPGWWGALPRLDRLIFRTIDRAARADELANNGIDWFPIGSSVDLFQRARTTPGIVIRQALEKQYNHITFNGAPGSIMEDPALRRAIAKGIDAPAIGRRLVGQIVPAVTQQGSHIFPIGAQGYTDNSAITGFDPAAANAELDALGWVRTGDVRVKDGRALVLRYVTTAANPIAEQISQTVQQQLAQVGVRVVIEPVPAAQFFDDAVIPGNFDMTGFQWVNTATPFSSVASLYAKPGDAAGQNFGGVFDPEILALFDQGFAELDPAKRAAIGDRIDKLVWQEVHHLPLYPSPGAYAVRDTLANWGAKGLGDWDYIRVGFTR